MRSKSGFCVHVRLNLLREFFDTILYRCLKRRFDAHRIRIGHALAFVLFES